MSATRQVRSTNNSHRQEYVYGNTVRQPEAVPVRRTRSGKDKQPGPQEPQACTQYEPGICDIPDDCRSLRSYDMCVISEAAVGYGRQN